MVKNVNVLELDNTLPSHLTKFSWISGIWNLEIVMFLYKVFYSHKILFAVSSQVAPFTQHYQMM